MDDTEAMSVDIFNAHRQDRLRGGAHLGLVLGSPPIQPGDECRNEGAELRALASGPLLRGRRNAVGPHPPISLEIRLAVELRSATAGLRVQPQQQLRV